MTNKFLKVAIHDLLIKGLGVFVLLFTIISPGFGQTEEEASDTDGSEKLGLRLSFDLYKINDDYKLVAKARAKIDKRYEFVEGVEINFYKGEVASQYLLGKGITNENGAASLIVSSDQLVLQSAPLECWAAAQNNTRYEDEEKSGTIYPAYLSMELEEDSIKIVKVSLMTMDSLGEMTPIEEASCQLYVKRMFGKLPVGDAELTDEEGRISFMFPDDIPGDNMGIVTVIASIADNEIVGNIEVNSTVNWGVPITEEYFYSQRELWSARANSPISLILIVNTVLIGVWGVIFYIFLEIIKINKIGKKEMG